MRQSEMVSSVKKFQAAVKINIIIFTLFISLQGQIVSASDKLNSACDLKTYTENLNLLQEQQTFTQRQINFYQKQVSEISSKYQLTSKANGLQKAFFALASYAMTSALFLEGFGIKTAGGLVNQGRLATHITTKAATKWQAFRKVMLFGEEAVVYPLAPFVFSGYSSPRMLGEGLGEFAIGGEKPEENTYDIESLPLTGFVNEEQWSNFRDALREDLHAFYNINLNIYNERARHDEAVYGISFDYFVGRRKEYLQKLYDESHAHLQVYKFQKNYLSLVQQKMTDLCIGKTILFSLPTSSPLVLKEIPIFTVEDYLKNVSRFPAPIKRSLNRFERYSLSKAKKEAVKYESSTCLSDKVKIFLKIIADIMTPIDEPLRQNRLNTLVNKLRPHVYDDGMRDCYNAQLMGSDINNAINVGCDTYVTDSLMDKLNDHQLLAVLAHELSHGDQGHLVMNVLNQGTSFKRHVMNYFSDILDEATSGVTKKHLDSVRKTGHLDSFISIYSELAPKIEKEADQGAVLILERAGIDRKHLIDALIILHGLDPAKVNINRPETMGAKDHTNGVRNYPGLWARIRAINAVQSIKRESH